MEKTELKIITDYLIEKIVNDISLNSMDLDLIITLNKYPIIDNVRESARQLYFKNPDILIEIKKLLEMENIEYIRFSISILSKILQSKDLRKYLDIVWGKKYRPEEKIFLVYYYLNLPEKEFNLIKQDEIYNFVTNNWDEYLNHSLQHLKVNDKINDKNKLLLYIQNRFEKIDQVPLSKAWIYLLLASIYPNEEEIKKIVSYYKTNSHPIISKIIREYYL